MTDIQISSALERKKKISDIAAGTMGASAPASPVNSKDQPAYQSDDNRGSAASMDAYTKRLGEYSRNNNANGPQNDIPLGIGKTIAGIAAGVPATLADWGRKGLAAVTGVELDQPNKYMDKASPVIVGGIEQLAAGVGRSNTRAGIASASADLLGGKVIDGQPAAAPAVPTTMAGVAKTSPASAPAVGAPVAPGAAATSPIAAAGQIGVKRQANGVTEFSGNNVGVGATYSGDQGAIAKLAGGTVTSMPAAAFAQASPAVSRQLGAARQTAASNGDFDAIRNSYQGGGGTFNGDTALDTNIKTIGDMALAAKGAKRKDLAAMQAGLIAQKDAMAKNAIAAKTAGTEDLLKRGQVAAQTELDTLRKQILSEKDPQKRKTLYDTFLALSGKNPNQDKVAIVDVDTGQQDAMGQPIYKKGAINIETGQMLGASTQNATEKTAHTDARAAIAKGMSKEEVNKRLVAAGHAPI